MALLARKHASLRKLKARRDVTMEEACARLASVQSRPAALLQMPSRSPKPDVALAMRAESCFSTASASVACVKAHFSRLKIRFILVLEASKFRHSMV